MNLEKSLIKVLSNMLYDPSNKLYNISKATLFHISNLSDEEYEVVIEEVQKYKKSTL